MTVAWLKKGEAAQQAISQYEQEVKLKQESKGRMFRFYLKKDEEARVTFVDGALTPEGILDIITFREHQIYMQPNGWNNFFVCTSDLEPCPICETGDNSALVGILTVIDHRTVLSKDKSKTYKDQQRLFVAKKDTIKMLQNIAVKRGGLSGATFDIMRVGDKSAAVGTNFDFIEKRSPEELKTIYQGTDKDGKPYTKFAVANYEVEVGYQPAEALRKLGFGGQKIGGESAPVETPVTTVSSKDLDAQL